MAEPENGQGFVTPTSDVSQVNTWWSSGPYDVRGDVDLDGDVDATDSSTISTSYYGIVMGRGVLSESGVWNRRGYAGARSGSMSESHLLSRRRTLDSCLGRWTSRDPLERPESQYLYQFVSSQPGSILDPSGMKGCALPRPGLSGEPAEPAIMFLVPPGLPDEGKINLFGGWPPESVQGLACKEHYDDWNGRSMNEGSVLGGATLCDNDGNMIICVHGWPKEFVGLGGASGPGIDAAKRVMDICIIPHEITHAVAFALAGPEPCKFQIGNPLANYGSPAGLTAEQTQLVEQYATLAGNLCTLAGAVHGCMLAGSGSEYESCMDRLEDEYNYNQDNNMPSLGWKGPEWPY